MKQTAVEFLEQQIRYYISNDDRLYDMFKQAKEMDKEQKIEFANNYGFDICGYDYEKAEQYYNETFKSE